MNVELLKKKLQLVRGTLMLREELPNGTEHHQVRSIILPCVAKSLIFDILGEIEDMVDRSVLVEAG